MDFIDEVRNRSTRFARRLEHLATEEATKTSLVMPFIEMLGYHVFDPTEVIPEFTADFGNKRGEKVDYALVQHGQPVILIEAKKHGTTLKVEQESQLFRYFSATDARFAILTDGIVYRFYSDLDNIKEMDKKPFFEFNMLDFTEVQVEQLKQFHKDKFNLTETVEAARDLKYTNEIKRVLFEEMNAPCDDFVRFILNRIDYPGLRTKNRIEQLVPVVKQAFTQFVNDLLEARLKLVWNEQPPGPIVEEVQTKTETVARAPLDLFLKTRGEVQAQARRDEDGFVVLAGAKLAKEELPTLLPVYSELRKTMLEDGRLVDDGSVYRLTQDHTFKTSSAAACFVTGFSNSGPRTWKDSNGIPLRDL